MGIQLPLTSDDRVLATHRTGKKLEIGFGTAGPVFYPKPLKAKLPDPSVIENIRNNVKVMLLIHNKIQCRSAILRGND